MPSLLDMQPEVFLSTGPIASFVSRGMNSGQLRKLAPKLYTRNLVDDPEQVVRRHLWRIVGLLFPGAVIVDRTALNFGPATDGSVFVASATKRRVDLPGVSIRSRVGHGPLVTDREFPFGLHLSSPARAYLENLVPSRARKGVARTLSRREIEERLDSDLRARGEAYLNELRDDAQMVASELGLESIYAEFRLLVGALLGTQRSTLKSHVARARARGNPFDPKRCDLFLEVQEALRRFDVPVRRETSGEVENRILSFFEAYFSNFIEGTEFEVDEAADIVLRGKMIVDRPADAHDILGTYEIVSDRGQMSRTPRSASEFIELLRLRHATVMAGRPDMRPGEFKTQANRAGTTDFVAPELVVGTLEQGFEVYRTTPQAFLRAVLMMFIVSEVHPFTDGNGRVARIMMNAELVSEGERRIIVPTVYRNNYIAALKAVSQNSLVEPLFRTLNFAQSYTSAIDFTSYEHAETQLRQTHAFLDPRVAETEGIRLRLPSP